MAFGPREDCMKVVAMKGWLFTRFSDGWRWHDFSGEALPRRSVYAFPSLLECLSDATRNGYSPDDELALSCGVHPKKFRHGSFMTLRRHDLLVAYQGHLAYWRERLDAADPGDTEKLEQIRGFIAHYERQIAAIKQQDDRAV